MSYILKAQDYPTNDGAPNVMIVHTDDPTDGPPANVILEPGETKQVASLKCISYAVMDAASDGLHELDESNRVLTVYERQ